MILPTPRAIAVLAGGAALGLGGFVTPLAVDVLVAIDILLICGVLADGFLAPRLHHVTVTRQGAETFWVGRPQAVVYRWTNTAKRMARLWVREVRPDILGTVTEPRLVRVTSGASRRESVEVAAQRRGKDEGGWFAVRSRGPLGLGQRQFRIAVPWTVTAYPSLPAGTLRASLADAVKRRVAGQRAVRQLGEGRQFESLREWVPGDDTRSIDWKATARRRTLIARQYEAERRQQVMLVVDAGRLLAAEVRGVALIEHALRAAQLMALAATYHDDDVGTMVFADEVMQFVRAQRGRRALRLVLDALAGVEPRMVEPDYPAAFRYLAVRNRKRALTVVFTDAIDAAASEALVVHVGSLRPRHLPLVVALRNPELDRLATARPADATEAYRKAAAEELLMQREGALARMTRTGAVVLDVDPEHAGPATVARYLELKRRGRL